MQPSSLLTFTYVPWYYCFFDIKNKVNWIKLNIIGPYISNFKLYFWCMNIEFTNCVEVTGNGFYWNFKILYFRSFCTVIPFRISDNLTNRGKFISKREIPKRAFRNFIVLPQKNYFSLGLNYGTIMMRAHSVGQLWPNVGPTWYV